MLSPLCVCVLQGTADGRKKGSNHNGGNSYGTLPKQGTASYSSTPSRNREGASIERDISTNSSSSSAARRSRGFPMLGKTLLRIRSGKRSSSAPNLGEATPSSLHEAPVKPCLLICMLQTYMQPPSFFPFLPSFPVPPVWKLIASQNSCQSFCFMARHWSVAGHVTDAPWLAGLAVMLLAFEYAVYAVLCLLTKCILGI